jgi:hypothetical protein
MSPKTESRIPVSCTAGLALPFIVGMLNILFPALLTNCDHGRCLSHVGTEGGPKTIGAFLTFLHEKMYPGFRFIDVKIYMDTPDQAFGEYTIHQKSGISGKERPSAFLRTLHGGQWKDCPAP